MGALQGSLRTARVKTKHSHRGARIYDRNFYFLVQPGKFFLQSRAGPYMGALQGSLRTARVKTKHSNRGARIYDRNFYFLVQPGKFFLQSRAGPYMTK